MDAALCRSLRPWGIVHFGRKLTTCAVGRKIFSVNEDGAWTRAKGAPVKAIRRGLFHWGAGAQKNCCTGARLGCYGAHPRPIVMLHLGQAVASTLHGLTSTWTPLTMIIA